MRATRFMIRARRVQGWTMVDYVPITEFRRLDERLTLRVIMRIYMTRGSIRAIDERVNTLVEVLE